MNGTGSFRQFVVKAARHSSRAAFGLIPFAGRSALGVASEDEWVGRRHKAAAHSLELAVPELLR
jgi:hypothetical protein